MAALKKQKVLTPEKKKQDRVKMKALLPRQQVTKRQRGMMGFRHMDANMYRRVCSVCNLCSETSVSAL